jgi:hypothetical protein
MLKYYLALIAIIGAFCFAILMGFNLYLLSAGLILAMGGLIYTSYRYEKMLTEASEQRKHSQRLNRESLR